MENGTIYLISGLGADFRLFQKLRFPTGFAIVFIDWIAPRHKETLPEYSKRLSLVINQQLPFYIVGVSFGGMIASEISRITHPSGTIIISSASSASEIPWYYKTAGRLYLPNLLLVRALKVLSPFSYWFFGAHTSEERFLLRSIIYDTDVKFLKWALWAIPAWKTRGKPENLRHIHGSEDKVLPLGYTAADTILEGAEHLMIYRDADFVSSLIDQIVTKGLS